MLCGIDLWRSYQTSSRGAASPPASSTTSSGRSSGFSLGRDSSTPLSSTPPSPVPSQTKFVDSKAAPSLRPQQHEEHKNEPHQSPSVETTTMAAAVASQNTGMDMRDGNVAAQKDKDFVAHFSDVQRPLTPGEVAKTPKSKELGRSSSTLSVNDFDLVRTLGTGTFARVWLVRLRNPKKEDENKVFALKVLRKAEVVRLKQVDHVNQERAILADVAGHPFITTLITTFSDKDSLYMLLDYCPGGEIFSYLRKAKRFSENASRFYIAEIVLILEFLHETEGVAYRDLKPENILLDAEGHVKLVDFGFAKRVKDRKWQSRETYTLCGTPEYLAPEIIQSLGHTTAVDWWALGILLYEFLTGYPPFWHQQPMEIYKQILNKPITFPSADRVPTSSYSPSSHSSHQPLVSRDAQDLILQLCTVDRHKRLGNIEGGARRVKSHPFFKGVNWEDVYYRKYKGPIIPPIRYAGDAQCFDTYPDEKAGGREWTVEAAEKWDESFRDF